MSIEEVNEKMRVGRAQIRRTQAKLEKWWKQRLEFDQMAWLVLNSEKFLVDLTQEEEKNIDHPNLHHGQRLTYKGGKRHEFPIEVTFEDGEDETEIRLKVDFDNIRTEDFHSTPPTYLQGQLFDTEKEADAAMDDSWLDDASGCMH
jgi:hypothetical protein